MSENRTSFRGAFKVSLPVSDADPRVNYQSVEIRQEIEKHDIAIIEASSRYLRYYDAVYPGTPILIEYQNMYGIVGNFVGYVIKVDPSAIGPDDMYRRTITCVAASREFRNTARNSWRNRTAPEIVEDIGKKLGFRVVTKQHKLRRKQVVQGGATYWEVLTKLAKMTGYVLRAEGTTLYFLPLKEMVKAFASTAPILADTAMASRYPVTALEIDATLGNTSDDDDDLSDAAVVVSLGPNDDNPATSRAVPESAVRARRAATSTYEKYSPGVVAHSRAEAALLAKGMADRGMMAYDGRVFGAGNPQIAPYRPVYVATVDQNVTGYWIVKSVVHRLTRNEYTCTTIISTDEVSSQRSAPPGVQYRDLSQELQQGWSPFVGSSSRLRILSPSFVRGKTSRADGRYARWVSV